MKSKILILGIFTLMLIFFSSCLVLPENPKFVRHSHDNGQHKGWYKNPKNPHHPRSTKKKHYKHKHH